MKGLSATVASRPARTVDVAGGSLFVAAIAWPLLVGSWGDSIRAAEILACSGAVLLVARLLTGVARIVVPVTVLCVAAALAVGSRGELFSARALSGPFGYANAKGAFFTVAAIAGLMTAVGASNLLVRLIGAGAAIASALVPLAAHVAASTILLVLPLSATLFAIGGRRSARIAIALFSTLFALAIIGTAALGTRSWSGASSALEMRIRQIVTYERLELWHEAEQLMFRNPVTGVGPGRFGDVAPLSRKDPSNLLFWAQNEFLQQGAEQGFPGFVLLLSLFAWGFVALWASPRMDATVVLAASALAAVGIQACEDYILHFPAVALATSALVGAGIAPPHRAWRAREEGSNA